MTSDQIRKLQKAQPFVAFDLNLTDGRRVGVDHPENIMISQNGRTAGVAVPDGTIEIIDILLITSVKPRPGNGAPRRRRAD